MFCFTSSVIWRIVFSRALGDSISGYERDFGPYDHPVFVTEIIKFLRMLVMRKADRIAADFCYELHILLCSSDAIAHPMFSRSWCLHTPRRGYSLPLRKKPFSGSTRKVLIPNLVPTASTTSLFRTILFLLRIGRVVTPSHKCSSSRTNRAIGRSVLLCN